MNKVTHDEQAIDLFGIQARRFNVVTAANGRILNQKIGASKEYTEGGRKYRIVVSLRFDDECNNGHETFSITANIDEWRNGRYCEDSGGCLHEEIARRFPALAHLVQWHLVSTDGPMHYVANTVYHAGDRDYHGLRAGEVRQIRNGRTGELCWKLDGGGVRYHDGPTPPADPAPARWEPWTRTGKGKVRDFDAARRCAVWPDATEAELSAEPDVLLAALLARLPRLLAEFKTAMIACGFVWPERGRS